MGGVDGLQREVCYGNRGGASQAALTRNRVTGGAGKEPAITGRLAVYRQPWRSIGSFARAFRAVRSLNRCLFDWLGRRPALPGIALRSGDWRQRDYQRAVGL